jgi:enoyl-CoA hydratase/carnithine racemase
MRRFELSEIIKFLLLQSLIHGGIVYALMNIGRYVFSFLELDYKDNIATIWLNNPSKANCLNETLWFELGQAVSHVEENTNCRVIVLRAKGRHFSSGIDFNFLSAIHTKCLKIDKKDRHEYLHLFIVKMQESFNQFESCKLPIIAMIHGACIGGAVDLISACDMRFCTFKSAFSIMETKLGIVADMGTLQRLRFIMSESNLRKLAFTSELVKGYRAYKLGMVSRCFMTKRSMEKYIYKLANQLVAMPKDALQGTKKVLNYSRNTSIEQGLANVAEHNAKALQQLQLPDFMSQNSK